MASQVIKFGRCVIATLLLVVCSASGATLSPEDAKKDIAGRAHAVIEILAHREFSELSRYVSEDKGVRFSPYAQVDTSADIVLKRGDLRNPHELQAVRTWGSYDGSGAPIRMSFAAYYNKFIYDRDFDRAPKIGYNEEFAKSNTTNNAGEVYPDSIVVEYYFPPPADDPEKATQWSALRLIFQKTGAEWFLVGVIHDQWTT
jgi:hypothetical protein